MEYIKNIPLFKHLKDAQLKEIAARCKKRSLQKGRRGLSQDGPEHRPLYRQFRQLKAVLADEEGGEIRSCPLRKGRLLRGIEPARRQGRSATIVADGDAELSVLKKDVFLELLYKEPRIAVELMATLVDRLRKADDLIESLAFLEVGERLVRALLDAAAPGKALGERFSESGQADTQGAGRRIGPRGRPFQSA